MKKSHSISSVNKLVVALLLALLTACGGGGGGSGPGVTPEPVLIGVLTDAVVAGVTYSTQTQTGITNSGGQFRYRTGEMVTFFIGDIQLGPVTAGPVVTPLTLAGATNVMDQQVTNIVRLLLTLDADGNADNGVQITEATRIAATGAVIDFDVPIAEFASDASVVALIAAADTTNIALVNATDAQTHLNETLATSWGLMDWGAGQWSAN